MAEKSTEGRRMSENILSDEARDEQDFESAHRGGGRKSGEKPKMELYRPRMGMMLRRSDEHSWRNSKSPSPLPHDHINTNRQVNQSHNKLKQYNKKYESRNGNDAQNQMSKRNPSNVTSDLRSLSINTNTDHMAVIDLTLSPTETLEEKKRQRKPEQQIYVAKPQSEKKEPHALDKTDDECWDDNTKTETKKKRKPKGKGRGREAVEGQRKQFGSRVVQRQPSDAGGRYPRGFGGRRGERDEPASPEAYGNDKTDARDFRQNSEPRLGPQPQPGSVMHARSVRDSRSMEHSGWIHNKPPPGRKQALDAIPPRFRKKYLEEKGMTVSLPANSFIGTSSEEQWDGDSLSFLNTYPAHQWQTLPPSKSRGRGRLRGEDESLRPMPIDSGSSDSRPTTPLRLQSQESVRQDRGTTVPPPRSYSCHDDVGRQDDRYLYRHTQQPPRLPETGSQLDVSEPVKTFDWSEEVEECERQEREAMSRSSSLASLNTHAPPPDRTGRRTRRRSNRSDRSLSRESGREPRNQRRQSDENVSRTTGARGRNKGHYGFHRNNSRESSRERDVHQWRGGDEQDWRRGNDKKEQGTKDWREERRNDDKLSQSLTQLELNTGTSYQQRGFLHLQKPLQQPCPPPPCPQQPCPPPPCPQRQLYDPNNPTKPIIVNSLNPRVNTASTSAVYCDPYVAASGAYQQCLPGEPACGPYPAKPGWLDPCNDSFRRHRNPILLLDIERAGNNLQCLVNCCKGMSLLNYWHEVHRARQFLQQSLFTLLTTEVKFCVEENVEQHMWKIMYYNLIEALRKHVLEEPDKKENLKGALLSVVDEGIKYFEKLLSALEDAYNFKVETYLSVNGPVSKPSGSVKLALISSQKIMLYLGDLARYREMANESTNYGKSKVWYTKAQQLNPKNGRPYYQLGLLAYFGRRRLDAVYNYMRSLMAPSPLHSAKESLVSLFDENRKKFEQIEKKRREERECKYKERVKEKEGSSLRREIWVHPCGRRRVHRTTSTSADSRRADSDEEELSRLSSADINKRFTISYLHVHGKLFSKVGMETFQDTGVQMLREFRALLQHTPLPLAWTRFLQLLALNMFAIENTQLKDASLEPGYRSAVQESALIISLQMFNLVLERTASLLREEMSHPSELRNRLVGEDVSVLLPAVKVWCDWLLCHSPVWNPPPCCSDYRVGPPGDAWTRLAQVVNLLEKLEHRRIPLLTSYAEGLEVVRLPEDSVLSGFTPLLLLNEKEPVYTNTDHDMELAQCCLRIRKILFFGTVFLCGLEPPVLKLHKLNELSEYVSVVDSSGQSQASPTDDQSDAELLVESFSEEEQEECKQPETSLRNLSLDALDPCPSMAETRRLLIRREELERRHERQEKHKRRVQAILEQSGLSVVIEVRPKYLVPDTNCFIDYLSLLQRIAMCTGSVVDQHYVLAIPLVVVSELEGLARGGQRHDRELSLAEKAHAGSVAESARIALGFLRAPGRSQPTIRCVTTSGVFIPSFTPFNMDDDVDGDVKNDDRVLATCLSLCRHVTKEHSKPAAGEPRLMVREVVLLTEDRNLRVKALARDVPVREVPDFALWAGLG